MTLEEISTELNKYTKVASESGRTLGFGAAAVAWAFRGSQVAFPEALLVSLIFVAAFFVVDVLQYITVIVGLRRFITTQERQQTSKIKDIHFPKSVVRTGYIFFLAKFPLLLFAYACLGFEFVSRFTRHT